MGEGSIVGFDGALLGALSARAAASPRLRQHQNIHHSYADPCQRLLNAIEPGSYLRPYKHARNPRNKLLVALRGRFAAVLFEELGAIERVVPFGAEPGPGVNVAVEIAADCWSSVVSLALGSVLLEVKAGPFDPGEPSTFPGWAPPEGTPEARDFVRRLEDAASHLPVDGPHG